MRKVLSTVVATLPVFFKKHPDKKVHVGGSTDTRKLYYHKLVRDYYTLIAEHYFVEGCIGGAIMPFEKGMEYEFILMSLKV